MPFPLAALLRGLLVAGLLIYFVTSLVTAVVRDQRTALADLVKDGGSDRGIRVLLLDRSDKAGPRRTHERLRIDVLRPCWLTAPRLSDPQYTVRIEPGEQLLIDADADGPVIASSAGREERWPAATLRLQPRQTVPTIDAQATPGSLDPMRFEDASREGVFAIGGRRYRGSLQIVYLGPKKQVAINALPCEAYVEGVVAVEMKPSFPLEALKAQAIASRSYAFAKRIERRGATRDEDADVLDSLDDQEYRGTGFGNAMVAAAVRSTAGIVLTTADHRLPFLAMFSASSGGYTASADTVIAKPLDALGRTGIAAYMPSVADPWCQPAAQALGYQGSHWETTRVLLAKTIQERLGAWLKARGDTRTIGYITGLRIADRDPQSERVLSVEISHTPLKKLMLSGHDFRMLMGPQEIRSTLWVGDVVSVDNPDDRRKRDFQITCRGWGHGVGMSQISAWAMAQEGHSAASILAWFYPGAVPRPW